MKKKYSTIVILFSALHITAGFICFTAFDRPDIKVAEKQVVKSAVKEDAKLLPAIQTENTSGTKESDY